MKSKLFWMAAALLAASFAAAGDWPQLLGPNRNGVYDGGDLDTSWPEKGPRQLWTRDVGAGFSNPVVGAGRLILFHRRGDNEIVESLDARTGEPDWKFEYPSSYRDDFGFDEGPRASPVIVAGQVYTFGAQGVLHCLQLAGGKKIWSVDTVKEFGVRKGFFGAASTPLVEGSRLFLNVGGEGAGIVAFDKDTGRVLWKATGDEASYSSPVAATIGGEKKIVFFTREGLVVIDPATGEVSHKLRWRARMNASVNAAAPLIVGDDIFLSASYGTGATLIHLNGPKIEQLWSTEEALTNHYATSVYSDGILYGYHGRQEYTQSLRAIEAKSGKVLWEEGGFGAGTITLAGGRLLLMRENGELVLAEASPRAFRPLARARILNGTVRAYPAIAGGLLYVRNESSLACIDLRKRPL